MPDPRSWLWGLPKSDDEGWRYNRRNEVLDTARMFMLHYVKTLGGDEFSENGDDDRKEEALECVKLAEALIATVDSRHMRA